VTYKEWADLLQASFEKCYWVPEDPMEDVNYDISPGMVNRRGIYKDVYGTPKDREWSDYQVSFTYSLPSPRSPGSHVHSLLTSSAATSPSL
jgi:glycogen debranching enzyme